MNTLKGVAKGGGDRVSSLLHRDKPSSSSSSRPADTSSLGTLRGVAKGGSERVSSLLNRDKPSSPTAEPRVAAPLSSLQDPSTFAPPPRSATRTDSVDSHSHARTAAERRAEREATAQAERKPAKTSNAAAQEEGEPAAPAAPFRLNTTGIATDHLPPPPTRVVQRANARPLHSGAEPPPPYEVAVAAPAASRPKPALPPRLPPRELQAGGAGRRPPPPPPRVGTGSSGSGSPPPVPLATKPK